MRPSEERVTLLIAESGRAVGGPERVVWELATRLPAKRFEVHVWLTPDPGVDELAAALEARGVSVHRVPDVSSRWDWKGMVGTWRRLRALRPDVLHIHHVWPAANRYLSMLAGFAAVPHVVVTEHVVGRSASAPQRALKKRELEDASAVTAVCGAIADALVAEYGIDRALVRVVGNGADPPDAEAEAAAAREIRQAFGARPDRPLYVCAARLEEQKGHAVLIDALAALREDDADFVAALAGTGSLREALERRVRETGLDGHVRFLGALDDIGPLLSAADVVVLPSLWEGLPLILLEAMARARPVVASAVGGIPEVVEDGVSGLLVPPGRPDALAVALGQMRRHPRDAEALGAAAAARVRADFTWARVVERFEAVYDEVLGLATFAPPGSRAGVKP
jgi:glycosyltransferase involved in cell wall biosynthesis